MSRTGYRGPQLPKVLLEKVQNGNKHGERGRQVSRKDRRKAERQQKKYLKAQPGTRPPKPHKPTQISLEDRRPSQPAAPIQTNSKPLKSILKKTKSPAPQECETESESEDEPESPVAVVPRGVRKRIAEDDADIAELEKKLGIKGKSSKALQEDGLDWLADGSASDSEDEERSLKRKRPEDTKWLQEKRVKASKAGNQVQDEDEDFSGISTGEDADDNDFDGFKSDESIEESEEDLPSPKIQRENPYRAPVSEEEEEEAVSVPKYIPPSRRKPAESDEQALRVLRRQIQGQLNRLSEANVLSILQSVQQIYQENPRQHVTSTLVTLLVGLISDSSTLNDTFLILHAGFSTALYKAVGTDFGAQLLEKLVEAFDQHRNGNNQDAKQALNLLAFLSNLYTFQLVGSGIMFDYIRFILNDFSEANAELLLRVVRTSGQQLRSDDPSSLKDIVLLVQRSVARIGEDNLSVRTKFMVETINDLKNNRMKTKISGSALAAEHTARMKKTLSSMNQSHSSKATEPLHITLADIKDSEKKGKWWLVGASYMDPAKHSVAKEETQPTNKAVPADLDSEYEREDSIDLQKLARNQGMNTDVRRAIFVTLLSSADYKHAHMRLLKLNLKAKQILEIPRVIVHCAGAEESYNPYYAFVARQFCNEHKMRKAFEFRLWDAFREMGEPGDYANGDEDVSSQMPVARVVNYAKLYGDLVGDGALSLRMLKKLDFTSLKKKTAWFVEVAVSEIFLRIRKKVGKSNFEEAVKDVFSKTKGLPHVARGLQAIIEEQVSKAEISQKKKDKKVVVEGCDIALEALTEAASGLAVMEADDDDEEEE